MLTLDREQTTALDYSVVNTSIQETFTAIDRFEWQAIDELRLMRDNHYYKDGGYLSFEDYCEKELIKHGGYRRVRDLLSAKKVVDTLPEELKDKITNPSQTRPLLRLVKTPDKLQEVVAIAAQEKTFPTAADFAKAVQQVAPTTKRPTKSEKSQTQLCKSVTVSSLSHPRYRDSGVIEADAPNNYQQIVTFSDGERLLINNADLTGLNAAIVSESSERTYPKEYSEAIAALKEQHKQELEQLSQELRIGLQTEATARAEAQVQEQIQSLQQLFKQQKEQNIQLQQRLSEMEGLRKLEIENQQLLSRIQELERAVEERPSLRDAARTQQWGNTMTQQATKALNKQVKLALEKTIDLRSLAIEPPKENAQECLRLMGMALKNLASAMNNTQALEAAAIILGSEPTLQAIAYRAEQLQMLPQAVSDIRAVLAKPGCTWQDYWAVAQEYEVIKQDYWAELTTEETDLITALEIASHPPVIQVGSIVAYADPYYTLYNARGEVVEDLGEDEVLVAWDHWKNSLLAENQNCDVEQKGCHEGGYSAAPVAQNEECLSSAIADQPHEEVEAGNPTSLLVENSVSGVGVKAVHEGEGSAALILNPEKWSHEAIVARSNMRPVRREKLNRAANSGENPGFDFLQECWDDDPALQIVIKKLLAKCPQWGLVAADGVLVKWEG